MDKEILEAYLIGTIGEYGIMRIKEQPLNAHGKPHGRAQTWYDVCLHYGGGDIVFSSKKKCEAMKWAKEN